MAERLFTNATGAYGYEPEADNTLPFTFGEFAVPAGESTTAGHVAVLCGSPSVVCGGTGQTGAQFPYGIALDTVAGDASTDRVAKVVTSGLTTAVAFGAVDAGAPVVCAADGRVAEFDGGNVGDWMIGTAVSTASNGNPVTVFVNPAMLQVNI